MANNKIITLEPSDPGYPWIFRAMGKEMPQKIWVQGDVGLLKHPRLVAVAAARTDDQNDFARMYDVGFNCVAYDYVMVGLVAEIALLRGATLRGNKCIVLLASGLNRIGSMMKRYLCEYILSNGGLLLSVQPPEGKSSPSHTKACIRLQVALANPIIVIQHTPSSNTRYAMKIARKFGKRLFTCGSNDGPACQSLLTGGGADDIFDATAPLTAENERRLLQLEEEWQRMQAEERAKEMEEWARHPAREGMSYAFRAANGIDWDRPEAANDTRDKSADTEDRSEEAFEKEMEAVYQEYKLWCRHGMSKDDWSAFQNLVYRREMAAWQTFVFNGGLGSDFDGEFIFPILQFKIDRMADYWRHFSHCMNGDYVLSRLELASRLLQIIIKEGNEGEDMERLPARVNLRNKERFKVRHHGGGFYLGEEQEVRFNKAFCILFRLLQDNILCWWD